jgi:quercetin dioxygenase-like cupin family protein
VSGGAVTGRVKIWRLGDFIGEGAPEAPVTDPQTGGDIWQIWPATGGPELSVLYCKMAKGHQTGLHSHPSHHYGVIVRGGSLVYTDGIMARQYEGDLIHIPADVPHAFGGTEDEDCWLVDFVKPSMTVADITFYPERDAEVAAAYAECYRRLRTG